MKNLDKFPITESSSKYYSHFPVVQNSFESLQNNVAEVIERERLVERTTSFWVPILKQPIVTFVLLLHGKKAKYQASLDDLRYHLATTTDKPANQLPATEDAFEQYVLRAQYQVPIWNQSHIPKPETTSPVGNGWRISESAELRPVYYTKESAPAEVRDITHLYCSDKTCTGQKCPYVMTGLSCIDICFCAGECQNPNKPAKAEGEVSTDL